MVSDVASPIAKKIQLRRFEWHCAKLSLMSQSTDVTQGKAKTSKALLYCLNGKRRGEVCLRQCELLHSVLHVRKREWKWTITHRLHEDVFILTSFSPYRHSRHPSLVIPLGWDGREQPPWNGAVYSITITDKITLQYINSLAKSNVDDHWQDGTDQNNASSLRSILLMNIEIVVMLILLWQLHEKW
jgi:hypothetical protein